MARTQGHHEHEALKHRHKHYQVTHYLHQGENWGHLLSTHTHDHNHPALEHVHIPHKDVDKEHRREAHVHDHGGPRPVVYVIALAVSLVVFAAIGLIHERAARTKEPPPMPAAA